MRLLLISTEVIGVPRLISMPCACIEIRRADQHRFLTILPREVALRKRRAFVRYGLVGGNDGEVSGCTAVVNVLFRKVAGHHAAAQNDVFIAGHVAIVPRSTGDAELLVWAASHIAARTMNYRAGKCHSPARLTFDGGSFGNNWGVFRGYRFLRKAIVASSERMGGVVICVELAGLCITSIMQVN